jgi:hypothetical protein
VSVIESKTEIEYPESDGLPIGETDLHQWWMVRITDLLRRRYQGQRVYVSSNLLVYPEEGNNLRAGRLMTPAQAAEEQLRAAQAELAKLRKQLRQSAADE